MELSLQKTITFLLFILIGLFLKVKFKGREETTGIKKIILNLALPATIFIALLSIQVEIEFLILPALALFLNAVLFFAFPYLLPVLGIERQSSRYRTIKILIPSLAPGLSCFPFVLEYLGEAWLARAAMADLGNKVFVLMILYIVAMNWHYSLQAKKEQSKKAKIKSLSLAMISEPVNIFIVIALILVSFGINMQTLPFFISDTLGRLSLLMTPLVLLFIGLAVKIKRNQLGQIFSILILRAGLVVLLSGIFLWLAGISVQKDILLILSFGLSACSFWPFAHISAVESLETHLPAHKRTFNNNYAISILALSFPLSTVLILGVLSSGTLLNGVGPVLALAAVLLTVGFLPIVIQRLSRFVVRQERSSGEKKVKVKTESYKVVHNETN